MTEGPYTQYDAENGTVTVTYGEWSDTFDVDRLDHWIAFYKRLSKCEYGSAYWPVLAALEEAKGQVDAE